MSSTETDTTSAPFQSLTPNNHGPVVIVAAYVFLIISVLAVVVKLWTRITTTRKLAWTDFTILISLIFATVQTIALTISVDNGLGRHAEDISNSHLESVSKAFYASNILLSIALAGAKASITFLIISIKPARPVLLACYGVLGVTATWTVAAIFTFAFQCSLPRPWVLGPNTALGSQTCIDQFAMQIGIGAINILTDLAIVTLPFFMMKTVQVANSKKWMVSALFALRIVTPAFAICALVTFHTFYHSTPQDRTWNVVAPAIWTQVMLNMSIITACIPSIKRFLADIQSGLMGVNISEPYELTHSGGKYVDYGKGTTFGSKVATRLGMSQGKSQNMSAGRSRGEKDPKSLNNLDLESSMRSGHNHQINGGAHGRQNGRTGGHGQSRETSESVKGLTDDVIMQTIDYKVEYEDGNTDGSGPSRGSSGDRREEDQGRRYDIGVGR